MGTKLFFAIIAIIAIQACNGTGQKTTASEPVETTISSGMPDSTAADVHDLYKEVKFDSQKDFVCGMPVSAGVSDTSHYKDKVYGFCSKECKDEFVKNPSAYVAAK